MKHLQQKLIVICKSFNQSVYFVLIAFVFYLIVRKTSPILLFSTRKKKKLSYMSYFLVWKNPSVCLSAFSVLTSYFVTNVLPLPWSSLNLLVTEILSGLIYFTSSTDLLVMCFLFELTRDTNILLSYLWFLTVGTLKVFWTDGITTNKTSTKSSMIYNC